MTEPKLLYHYTTAQGLIGIVQSHGLWATNADFLNDAQELRFGRDQLREALQRRADELSPHDEDSGDANASRATIMRSAAEQLAPELGVIARHEEALAPSSEVSYAQRQYHFVYVACFCRN